MYDREKIAHFIGEFLVASFRPFYQQSSLDWRVERGELLCSRRHGKLMR